MYIPTPQHKHYLRAWFFILVMNLE